MIVPSRDVATSLIVLVAYLFQGYFDAVRTRMVARVGALFDLNLQMPIHFAITVLPLVNPSLAQQPLRDLDQVRAFLSGMGPTAFLDMPWMPLFLVALFLFHPAIGFVASIGVAAIVAMTWLTERQSQGAAKCAMEASPVTQRREGRRDRRRTPPVTRGYEPSQEQVGVDDTAAGIPLPARQTRQSNCVHEIDALHPKAPSVIGR